MFHKLYKTVLADVCCLCDTPGLPGLDLCHFCHKSLPHNHFCCLKCAAPLARAGNVPSDFTNESSSARICGRCLAEPTHINHAVIPFLYRPPLDYMIKRLKFSEQLKYSRLLGELLADAVERAEQIRNTDSDPNDCLPDLIVPVPIHRQRLLQRGFNQAEQIARIVASRFGIRPDTKSLARTRLNPSQTHLSAVRREANIRRAFEVLQPDRVRHKHVAVVDDVYTTGATARAIARRLHAAGASEISIWAVARTP